MFSESQCHWGNFLMLSDWLRLDDLEVVFDRFSIGFALFDSSFFSTGDRSRWDIAVLAFRYLTYVSNYTFIYIPMTSRSANTRRTLHRMCRLLWSTQPSLHSSKKHHQISKGAA
jgi:hypothetical protein